MCFGNSDRGSGKNGTTGGTDTATALATAQANYRKIQLNQVGGGGDPIGRIANTNTPAPTTALKKLMGS